MKRKLKMHKPEAGGQALIPADWTDDEDMNDRIRDEGALIAH